MKQKVQTGLLFGMIFLSATTFGQTKEAESKKINDRKKTAKTYLDLMVNVVSTNLNYGASNSALADYKKSANGIQAGVSFVVGQHTLLAGSSAILVALFEFSLGIYLVVKGFRPSAITAGI
ncbi:MAG: hypothetical protein ACHQD7_00215 [Chitinophagales bacterium]